MVGSIRVKTDKQGREFFEVVLEFRDPASGKRLQRSKSFPKEREAKRYLATFQVDQDKGTVVPPSRMTLADLLHQWLENYARHHVGAKTYVDYECTIRFHVVPALGG
jgi:hypothetical protein